MIHFFPPPLWRLRRKDQQDKCSYLCKLILKALVFLGRGRRERNHFQTGSQDLPDKNTTWTEAFSWQLSQVMETAYTTQTCWYSMNHLKFPNNQFWGPLFAKDIPYMKVVTSFVAFQGGKKNQVKIGNILSILPHET